MQPLSNEGESRKVVTIENRDYFEDMQGQSGPSNPPRHSFGGGGGGGMDAWQTSVEKRLGGLEDRLGRIEPDMAAVKTGVAVINTNLGHMPTKVELTNEINGIADRLTKKMQIYGGLIGVLIAVSTFIAKFL